jgi:hypothetical protein
MRTAHLSRQVTYSRGVDSVELAATVGHTTFEIEDGYGAVEKWESRDFLVAAAELMLGGALVQSQSGDKITDGGKVYEVMAPGKEDVCRPSDPYGVTLRIHTKQVE